ncbi:MAG: C1 family peptidase [Pseudomonadota bacterium]
MAIDVISDLRGHFGPARDQGARPTCMAFAASDAHAGVRPGWQDLCVEWAYFHGLKHDGGTLGQGVTLPGMLAALEVVGQPIETAWPYSPSVIVDPSTWAPPAGVQPLYRRLSALCAPTPRDVVQQVDAGHAVLMAMRLSDAFYFGADADGVIASSEPPDPRRRHAVVALGHGRRGATELVLIRNSWGQGWGQAGHAWIDIAYLAPRLYGAAVLTQEP